MHIQIGKVTGYRRSLIMGADTMDPRFNEFRVTAGNPGTLTYTPHVKVAVADDDMIWITKYILLGGGTCLNT